MTQTIITAGDSSALLAVQGGDDGTLVLKTGAAGSKVNALSFAADGTPTFLRGGMVLGTAVATTSGTAVTFTGIPSWAKRITVILRGVSTSGTNAPIVQIGSGSLTTTGYTSTTTGGYSGNVVTSASFTTGFGISNTGLAANANHAQAVLINMGGNQWQYSSALSASLSQGAIMIGGGDITLGGVLDRVSLTTVGSTDTFDAGSVNILYEG